jgi:formate dehydrogenase accessory protein FdhE
MAAQPILENSAGTDADLRRAKEALRLLGEVWRGTVITLPPGVPRIEAVEARLAGGVAALAGEPLVDTPGLLAVARRIAERLRDLPGYGEAAVVVARLDRAADSPEWHATALATALAAAVLSGAFDAVGELAVRLRVDAHALVTLLDYAARPALRAGAAAVHPSIVAAGWGRGSCPACGAAPALSVAHGKDGERSLHCGRCATSWPFPRVRCAGCGERNHRRLGVLHAAGEAEFRRVEVCETCRRYLKSVAALDAPSPDTLLELDLATAALDFAALDRGYHRL